MQLKEKVEFEDSKDEIYLVTCKKCGATYNGKTGQHFCQRREQHKGDIQTRKHPIVLTVIRRKKGTRSQLGRRCVLFINSQNSARIID